MSAIFAISLLSELSLSEWSHYLICLAEKPKKSGIAQTLCVLAIVKSTACSTGGKLLYGF